MATHYEPDEKNFAYKLEISEDSDLKNNWQCEPTITQIQCNGDFRNQICIELLKEADIVVTNPPFSLIREYILQLIEYDKKFLIIGPLNAVKYKDTFPLLNEAKMWIGYTHPKCFRVPDTAEGNSVFEENGVKYQKFGNIQWYTNLDIPKRHTVLDLRGNYYKKDSFQRYYNYEAIDIPKINDIPCDYDGEMGVPISFIECFNPNQFELIDRGNDVPKTLTHESINGEWIVYKNLNGEIVWKTPYTIPERKAGNSLRLSDNGIPGKLPYDRIIIRLKNPEPRRYPDEN